MIKSMTGFGRCEENIDGRDIIVEIKAVNHRFFELSDKVPRNYGFLDEIVKECISSKVSRGKIEVTVTINNDFCKNEVIEVNSEIAAGYINALREANAALSLTDDLTLSSLLRIPDVFSISKLSVDEEEISESVKTVILKALDGFLEMRCCEGEKMFEDLTNRMIVIGEYVTKIEARSPEVNKAYKDRLYKKLCEVLDDKSIDESRILTEAAIFADKTDVNEETVRLRSHIKQFMELIGRDEPVGRKLDFLIQEFNREVNTIGSKCQDSVITGIVLELKSEIEKVREQIQNIE